MSGHYCYYFDAYSNGKYVFSGTNEPIARKEHKCCECGKPIKVGEKYLYFSGKWRDSIYHDSWFDKCKTCLSCKEDWSKILEIFHKNGEANACIVRGMLREAIWDALTEDILEDSDPLIEKWIPESFREKILSVEEKDVLERQQAISQMRINSSPLI